MDEYEQGKSCVSRVFEAGVAEGVRAAAEFIPSHAGAVAGRGLRRRDIHDRLPTLEQHRR